MSTTRATPAENEGQPLYHEVSHQILMTTKIIGILTVVMVVIAFIICLVKGSENSTFYLLACNLVVSSIIGCVSAYWYKTGDLSADKYWFVMLIGGVIMFQCLTTDIYVFNVKHPGHAGDATTITSTVAPPTTAKLLEEVFSQITS